MVTAIMLSPCIDRILKIDTLHVGGLNRILAQKDVPGGKGLNVAKTLSRLGVPLAISGLMFEGCSAIILDNLKEFGIQTDLLSLPGHVRVNIKILDSSAQVVTEFNENSPQVDGDVLALFFEKIEKLSLESEYMVFSGSVPPGFPDDTYRQFIEITKKSTCRAVLDADGELFRSGIEAAPYLVKPNLFELELLTGERLSSLSLIKKAAIRIVRTGVHIVLVSLGAQGALIADKYGALYAPGLSIPVMNTVGAGDCMLAGAIFSMINSKPIDEILKMAVATATACVAQEETGLSQNSRIMYYYDGITIKEL